MKSILISIESKWCELIARGKKTIEVRRTRPKIETPFKCYIYCTHNKRKNALHLYVNSGYGRKEFGVIDNWRSGEDVVDVNAHLPAYRYNAYLLEGKVIGEFVCDWITEINPNCDIDDCVNQYIHGYPAILGETDCLSFNDMKAYLGTKKGYDWHISNLKIYDKPKELSEFKTPEWYRDCEKGCPYIERMRCPTKDSHKVDKMCGWCRGGNEPITRPPQSWYYVEK